MNSFIEKWFSPHWQYILGGILFYLGEDILCAAHANYWVVQSGVFLTHVSVGVIGWKGFTDTAKLAKTASEPEAKVPAEPSSEIDTHKEGI